MASYLKVSSAADVEGADRKLYRSFEIVPAFLAWGSLVFLALLARLAPVAVSYFIIAFDVYWLLLVSYLSIHLIAAYRGLRRNIRRDWHSECVALPGFSDIYHLVILPVYNENEIIIRASLDAILQDGYSSDRFIIVLAVEARAGEAQLSICRIIAETYKQKFGHFLLTVHPDNIVGEIKGKGANQAWAARQVRKKIIDAQHFSYDSIVVSVFDIDTIVSGGYFFRLTHAFLTVADRYKTSYQPIPVYHNNLWEAPFFARISATSNTFWQMMQQVRSEKLATYSSHSMSWRALVDIDFWATNMVSEDSRIFWHCFLHYNGDYQVEPLYFPVSMDVCMDTTNPKTFRNLYKQQRRWGWGVENVPYLLFNTYKRWHVIKRRAALSRIFVQMYGFHAWATNALIIGVIGWLPILIGGESFQTTALSGNLPVITRTLMMLAMVGLVVSAIISSLLLPRRPAGISIATSLSMLVQWIFLPIIIVIFGAFPALEAQTRLALGGRWRLGFWVTPKVRN